VNFDDLMSRIERLQEQWQAVEGDYKPAKKRRQRLSKRISRLHAQLKDGLANQQFVDQQRFHSMEENLRSLGVIS
jgi:septal ring factor EnvC (AmiA/AmiB activator)